MKSADGRPRLPLRPSRNGRDYRLIITDSGLGGLAVCAGVERGLRRGFSEVGEGCRSIRLIYVNAWPDERFGYNDLRDAAERARVFDRALEALERLGPDAIVIACNTLSILYGLTRFCAKPAIPVRGIIEAGVKLFAEALAAEPKSSLVLFGTRTTIESAVHVGRLVDKGFAPARIAAVACHGLAAAIDQDSCGPETERLLAACAAEACRKAGGAGSGTWIAGLACTHYGAVKDRFRAVLEKCSGRSVVVLDPNEHLASLVVEELMERAFRRGGATRAIATGSSASQAGGVAVEVISKVALATRTRRAAASRLEALSGLTAEALLHYKHLPDLF